MSSITPILQHHSGDSLVLRNQRKPRGRCGEEGARRTRRPPAANSVKRGTQNSETVTCAQRQHDRHQREAREPRPPSVPQPWAQPPVGREHRGVCRRAPGRQGQADRRLPLLVIVAKQQRRSCSRGLHAARGAGVTWRWPGAGAARARSHAGCSGVRGPGCPRGVWAQSPLDAKGQLCSRLQQQQPKEAKGPEPTAEGLWGRTGRRGGLPPAPAQREDASTARPSLLPSGLSCRNVCLF